MADTHESTIPRIITDRVVNSVNSLVRKLPTIEEWYDILHHTHSAESIVGLSDMIAGGGSTDVGERLKEAEEKVATLTTTVESLETTVAELKTIIEEYAATDISIGDYDVNTPGIQDIDGNTIG